MKRGIIMYRYENYSPMPPLEPPYRYGVPGAPGIDPLMSGLLGAGLGFIGGGLLAGGPGFGFGPGYGYGAGGPGFGPGYGPGAGPGFGPGPGAFGPGYGGFAPGPYGPGPDFGPYGY